MNPGSLGKTILGGAALTLVLCLAPLAGMAQPAQPAQPDPDAVTPAVAPQETSSVDEQGGAVRPHDKGGVALAHVDHVDGKVSGRGVRGRRGEGEGKREENGCKGSAKKDGKEVGKSRRAIFLPGHDGILESSAILWRRSGAATGRATVRSIAYS